MSRSALPGVLALVLLARAATAQAPDDVYPRDITPPPGTQYPCALEALPISLPGIPEAERGYINRTYARLLRATQAKLLALRSLEQGQEIDAALRRYDARTAALAEGLRGDTPPHGLEPFRDEVVAALGLHQAFFQTAGTLRRSGRSMTDVFAIPEGRQASQKLTAAFGRMQARYPAWATATRDSIYHHLCALDLF